MTSTPSALEGWTAGPWQVERRLGRGRVSDAFAVRGSDGIARVLRLVHPTYVAETASLARALDEARAHAHPPHPALVPVVDAGQLPDGRIYVVGEDLVDRQLGERGALDVDSLLGVLETLAPALDALHARGLAHGHLDRDALLDAPPRLTALGLGAVRPAGDVLWTGGREPGRRLDLGGLATALLSMLEDVPEASRARAVLERCASSQDALPFANAAALLRALRSAWQAGQSDPLGPTLHVPGPPPVPSQGPGETTPGTVGPYRIIRLLGEGAMGRVFEAERGGRSVALKLLKREHLRSRALLDRFFREARAVSRIRHPHIVQVLDVGEERGASGLERAYCVMELLDGKTLGALYRERRLTVERTVGIVVQVCEALEAAHATGVVHRDVKPDNIFVEEVGAEDRVKLLDFGVAKLLPAGGLAPRAGTVVGTPQYMAPEQSAGAPVDARTDLYAVGVVLHEMLSGRRPLRRPDGEVEQLPAESPEGESLSRALAATVRGCLSTAAEERPSSARVLAQALRAALGGTTASSVSGRGAPRAPGPRPGRRAS